MTVLRNVSGLKQLYLRKNQISIFDESFVNYVNKTPSLVTLRIDNNLFDCSCKQLYFQTWVKHSNLIEHKDDLRCHQPHSLQNQTVAGYKRPLFDCYIKWVLVGFAAFVGLLLVVMVTYRLRWYLAHIRFAALSVAEKLVEIKRQDECKYDAMVIFNSKSDHDRNWVKQLMTELEGGDYPNINLERPDERVSYFLIVSIELAFCFDNVNFALY